MNAPPNLPPSTPPPAAPTADEVLAAVPWGVLVLDEQYIIRRANQQAATWCGSAAEALLGQPLSQAPLPPALGAALHQLLEPGAVDAPEIWLPHLQRWLSLRLGPTSAGHYCVLWEDVTARRQAEAAQQRSGLLLLDMETVAHTGSYEADLATMSFYFSDGMYRLFGEAPQSFVPTLAFINARSHPDDATAVQQVLDEAVRTKRPYTYRRRIRRADGEQRTLEAHGEVRCDEAGNATQLRGLVQDITERVQAEQALHASRALLRATIDSSLDMVQVFEAVRDEQGAVVDFAWVLNNATAEQYYGDVIGQRLRQLNPGVVEEGIFDAFRQVLETGVPDQREHHYVHEQFDGWFYQSTVKLGDGVTTTTHDISQRKQAEQELHETKELLQATLDSSHYVVQAFEAVRDANGKIVDFTWILTNRVWLERYGGPMAGKSLLQENPGVAETGLFDLFVQVVETGVPVDHEQYYAHEQFDAWFHQTLMRMRDGFVMTTVEITERKQAQQEILQLKDELAQQATDRYHALFYSMSQGFCLLEILFEEASEQAIDFRYLEVNPPFAQESGMPADVQGKTARQLLPELDAFWFDTYGHIARTGEAQRLERYSPELDRWFDVHAFRMGPPEARQVGVLFSDVTARKQAEQHQQFQLQLADALRPLADAREIQRTATRVLGEYFGLDRAMYAEITPDGETVVVTDNYLSGRFPAFTGSFPLSAYGPIIERARHGEPLIVEDVAAEAELTKEEKFNYQVIGSTAFVTHPLLKGGRWVANLVVHQGEPRRWTPDEIALLRETAERTWEAVERARAEEALRVSETKYRTLFETIDEGFCVMELVFDERGQVADIIYREANAAFKQHVGFAPPLGQRASEAFPHIEPLWVASLERVQQTGNPERVEGYNADTKHWFTLQYSRVGGAGSPFVAAVFNDITERKRRESNLGLLAEVSQDLAQLTDIDATMAQLGARLGAHFGVDRVIFAEISEDGQEGRVSHEWHQPGLPDMRGAYATSDYFSPEFTQLHCAGRLAAVGDTAHDERVDGARYAALGVGAFVGVPLLRLGHWRFYFSLLMASPRTWTADELDLMRELVGRIWARLERARAEEALRTSEQRLRALVTNLPGAAVFIVGPDLRYQLAEGEALYAAGFDPASLLGRIIGEALPPSLAAEHERHYRLALAGHGFSLEHEAHGHTYISRGVPLLDAAGQVGSVLVVSYDITERKRAEEALQASEEQFRTVANLVPDLLWRSTPGSDTTWYNQQWYEYTGQTIEDATGYGWTDVIHPDDQAESARRYQTAVANGQFLRQEHRIRSAQGEYRWFQVQLRPVRNERGEITTWFGAATDIHARKQAELHQRQTEEHYRQQLEQQVLERTQQLEANRDLLQSVFDTSLVSMSVMEAVRDEAGAVQDFRLQLVNRELERATGRTDLVGKLYAAEYPSIRQLGLFDLMLKALATNEPQGMEYFYGQDGFNQWFTCQFVKLGNGVVATSLDVTERKTAEQERLKNLRLLEQAEAVAGLGSWNYDLRTQQMEWSAGMYRLLGLPIGQPVGPDVYAPFVVADDQLLVERLVRQLTSGSGNFEETLRLRVGPNIKTVRTIAVVQHDEAGHPVRTLGVDLDISELQRLETDNLHLRLTQQQALFEAVQTAQEAERRRMAESLHNGIGQILYATKLRLDRLHAPLLGTAPELVAARREADQLLSEAIRQARELSHELVPLVLEDFGLVAALQDISRKMSTPQLRLRSHVLLDPAAAPLPPPLQMALYRMAQELAQNIVKHARGATDASLELETTPGWVLLRAEDNGPGFGRSAASHSGLGLRSIRDRVALLGGQLKSGSVPTGGAYVRIRIPLPPSATPIPTP